MNRLLRIIQWIVLVVLSLGEMAFASSSKKAVLIGTDLELRCNYTHNATWWFDSSSLHGNTHLVNSTLILRINNVSTKSQGTYWCGSSWKHGYNVSVVVGNLPSQPRSVHSYSYEWNDSVRWVASLQTGGLPVYYTVTAQCPKLSANSTAVNLNCYDYGQNLQRLCKNVPHITNKKYVCSKYNMEELDLNTVYQVCVFAINELGNSSSCINFTRSNESYGKMTVPAPPRQFKATEFMPGQARLTWGIRTKWQIFKSINIYISYSKIEDTRNTTIPPVEGMDKAVIIPNYLMANSFYTFYAQSQYYTNQFRSVLSAPSVTSLQTHDATPDQPPQNLTCSPSGGSSQNKRNISLSWEPVPKESQNGVLTKYTILAYSRHQTFNKTVNASHTSIILPGFSNTDDVRFNIRACNERGYCSGIGNSCFVSAAAMETKIQGSQKETIIIIVVTVAGAIVLVLVLGYLLYSRHLRKKKSDQDQNADLPVIEPPDVRPPYVYPDNNPMREEYTQVDNPDQVPLIMDTF